MYKTLDLFAGAGGLSYGFEMTGKYEVVAAVELNQYARETYRRNHKNKLIEIYSDVRKIDFKELNDRLHIDVVIGGPPCQGFSNANRQKNHIVSMNNSLVKEYFRAIREIKPIAFIMENVSMLASDTHRFYDSTIDHDDIAKFHIETIPDEIIISNADKDLFDLLQSNYTFYMLNDQLVHLLNILYKKKNSKEQQNKYWKNHKIELFKCLKKEIERETLNDNIRNDLIILKKNFDSETPSEEYLSVLSRILNLQKALQNIRELEDNNIIYTLKMTENKIIAEVKSYAVIDYISAILGNEYVHEGVTLNATWFGVPQERKRHIRFGVRKDCAKESFVLPTEPKSYKKISVGEAILDLQSYQVTSDPLDAFHYYNDTDPISEYGKKMRKGAKGVYNHLTCNTSETALKRFKALKEGENFHNLPDEMKSTYANPARTQNTIYLRLNSELPSGTVVNVRKSMWIHPKLDRPVSVREAARLQSFPDRFVFEGPKDSQYQQVGNAVPPLLAKTVAEYLRNNINFKNMH